VDVKEKIVVFLFIWQEKKEEKMEKVIEAYVF